MKWSPSIQGLRALALGLVLLYHTDTPGFSGGFVGVDVFFVISGYLITSILRDEVAQTGRVSLSTFYARRIRRLMPSSTATILISLALGLVVLGREQLMDLAVDAGAATLFSANIHLYYRNTEYSNNDRMPSFLQHFWSLAVEEQFYMVWPSVLFTLTACGWKATGAVCITLCVALALASLAFAQYSVSHSAKSLAFFTLQSRAWELLAGCVLSLLSTPTPAGPPRPKVASQSPISLPTETPQKSKLMEAGATSVHIPLSPEMASVTPYLSDTSPHSTTASSELSSPGTKQAAPSSTIEPAPADAPLAGVAAHVLPWVGLVAVLYTSSTYSKDTVFPGLSAMLPVAGTMMMLLAPEGSYFELMMGASWLQTMGDASYSVYLTHWPLICVIRVLLASAAPSGVNLAAPEMLLTLWIALAASIALAALMYVNLETPLRFHPALRTLAKALGLMVLLMGACLLSAYLVYNTALARTAHGVALDNVQADEAAVAVNAMESDLAKYVESYCATAQAPDEYMLAHMRIVAQLKLYASTPMPLPADLDPPLEHRFHGLPNRFKPDPYPGITGDPNGEKLILLLGDSHSVAISPGMHLVAQALKMRLKLAWHDACGFFGPCAGLPGLYEGIKRLNPDFIIYHISFGYVPKVDHARALEFFTTIKAIGGHHVFLTDVNRMPCSDLGQCLTKNIDNTLACAAPQIERDDAGYRAPAEEAGFTIVDPMSLFCTPERVCPLVVNRTLVFQDCNHITEAWARAIAPALTFLLRNAIAGGA